MVGHLDQRACDEISQLYSKLIPDNATVLDLMSSWDSHLSEQLKTKAVYGLGMNAEELKANDRLTEFCGQDLNENPKLPYDDQSMDAVICTASVEYLVKPFEVFKEVARVLKPGGVFINTFSNRWFPTKAISVWSDLHEFERLAYVAEYYLQSKCFDDIHTYSLRGLPRPENDAYANTLIFSDPVYAVWATRK